MALSTEQELKNLRGEVMALKALVQAIMFYEISQSGGGSNARMELAECIDRFLIGHDKVEEETLYTDPETERGYFRTLEGAKKPLNCHKNRLIEIGPRNPQRPQTLHHDRFGPFHG